jgi:hypothetical protein
MGEADRAAVIAGVFGVVAAVIAGLFTLSSVRSDRPAPSQTTAAPAPEAESFAFSSTLNLVPLCATLNGSGRAPSSGEIVLLDNPVGERTYWYNGPVAWEGSGDRWTARMQIGAKGDAGQRFQIHAVLATTDEMAALEQREMPVTSLPGRELSAIVVTRSADEAGAC